MTTKTNSQTKVNPIKVIIVEDYKLTRVGLRYALNEFEHINVIGEAESGEEIHPDVKVIILTSHEREEEVLAALGSGAIAYCLKDIDPTALSEVIRSVAQGACWIDPNVAKLALKLFPKPENVKLLNEHEQVDPKGHLTDRETEVLKLLVKGKSNTEIAKELIVSVHTAKAHVCSILQKLCVDDRVQAAVKAIKEGIVQG